MSALFRFGAFRGERCLSNAWQDRILKCFFSVLKCFCALSAARCLDPRSIHWKVMKCLLDFPSTSALFAARRLDPRSFRVDFAERCLDLPSTSALFAARRLESRSIQYRISIASSIFLRPRRFSRRGEEFYSQPRRFSRRGLSKYGKPLRFPRPVQCRKLRFYRNSHFYQNFRFHQNFAS